MISGACQIVFVVEHFYNDLFPTPRVSGFIVDKIQVVQVFSQPLPWKTLEYSSGGY